jgi:hypothetical protein
MMKRNRFGLATLPVIAALLLSSCAEAVSDEYVVLNEPGSVEPIEGTDLARVTLDEGAAERLELRTTAVAKSAGGVLVVPSAAVFVDTEGVWWVYTNPEPNVFVRHEIGLERSDGGVAFLSSGPAPGTEVVTVGVPELYGVEAEVDH